MSAIQFALRKKFNDHSSIYYWLRANSSNCWQEILCELNRFLFYNFQRKDRGNKWELPQLLSFLCFQSVAFSLFFWGPFGVGILTNRALQLNERDVLVTNNVCALARVRELAREEVAISHDKIRKVQSSLAVL